MSVVIFIDVVVIVDLDLLLDGLLFYQYILAAGSRVVLQPNLILQCSIFFIPKLDTFFTSSELLSLPNKLCTKRPWVILLMKSHALFQGEIVTKYWYLLKRTVWPIFNQTWQKNIIEWFSLMKDCTLSKRKE